MSDRRARRPFVPSRPIGTPLGEAAPVHGVRHVAPGRDDLRPRLGRRGGWRALVERYLSYAYALLVAGVALWPPAVLLVAALYLVALAVAADRAAPPAPERPMRLTGCPPCAPDGPTPAACPLARRSDPPVAMPDQQAIHAVRPMAPGADLWGCLAACPFVGGREDAIATRWPPVRPGRPMMRCPPPPGGRPRRPPRPPRRGRWARARGR
ncbi:MAG: hypothetical protein U0667_15265 [Chloroflexota bacterium]